MKRIPCILCGSDEQKLVLQTSDLNQHIDDRVFNLVKCQKCSLHFLSPQPSFEELAPYYPSDYAPYEKNYQVFAENKLINFFRKFKNKTKSKSDFARPTPTISTKVLDTSIKNVLDFGCGGGSYLLWIQANHPNWKLYGFDIATNAELSELGKGIVIIRGDIELLEKHIPKGSLDIINLANVMEHINNPLETLRTLCTYLKKGGEFIIEVPNIDSIKFKIFGKYLSNLDIPRHLYHFNKETMSKICEKIGLTVKNVQLTGSAKSTVRSLYNMFGLRRKKIGPMMYRCMNTLTNIIGKNRINDDAVILVATKN
jgi:SAM-dependent methyltransferase